MTKEEIKQQSEEYANTRKYTLDELNNSILTIEEIIKLAFIAGAHSRDNEIKRLYNSLEHFRDIINNLYNPWISVDNRLPEEENNPDEYNAPHRARSSRNVIITDGTIINRGYYSYERKRWEWNEGEIKVTHWMSIPQL